LNIGIVGNEAAKFTPITESAAKGIIYQLLDLDGIALVSGGCHLGGIDIWAEEEADRLHKPKFIHKPKHLRWRDGFKPRNILIAQDSITVANIVVSCYPPEYNGMRFNQCYHCPPLSTTYHGIPSHVKSGGCWTAHYARKLGKTAVWYIIWPTGEYQMAGDVQAR